MTISESIEKIAALIRAGVANHLAMWFAVGDALREMLGAHADDPHTNLRREAIARLRAGILKRNGSVPSEQLFYEALRCVTILDARQRAVLIHAAQAFRDVGRMCSRRNLARLPGLIAQIEERGKIPNFIRKDYRRSRPQNETTGYLAPDENTVLFLFPVDTEQWASGFANMITRANGHHTDVLAAFVEGAQRAGRLSELRAAVRA